MGIIVWEGINRQLADAAYDTLKEKVTNYGLPLEVRIQLQLNKLTNLT
jgi:hypothetical protein